MKKFLTFLMMLLVTVSFAATRSYTLKKTLAEGESSSEYTFYQFPTKAFVNDTIAYGDTVTFNLYVDFNKHVPAAPVLYVLLSEAGTTDSLKVARTIYYSQISALGNDNLGLLESHYYKTFRTDTTAYDFSSEDFYPIVVADSIASSGLAYPSFSYVRSVLYEVVIIPLKTDVAIKVKDLRLKLYLQPAQFK